MTAIPSTAAFHRHIDTCRQCRENPFRLCAVGHAMLTGAANDREPVPPLMARAPEIVDGVE